MFIDGRLRVGLADGRVIVGNFLCFDKQKNILLNEAFSFTPPDQAQQRPLGMVVIAWKHVRTCHAAA